MGEAWGPDCSPCPARGSPAHRAMCGTAPAGMIVDPLSGDTHEIDECRMMPGEKRRAFFIPYFIVVHLL